MAIGLIALHEVLHGQAVFDGEYQDTYVYRKCFSNGSFACGIPPIYLKVTFDTLNILRCNFIMHGKNTIIFEIITTSELIFLLLPSPSKYTCES